MRKIHLLIILQIGASTLFAQQNDRANMPLTLYGTTLNGGSFGGVINKFRPGPNNLTVQESFESGSNVSASLIQATDGKLYRVTQNGGGNGYGVIFSFAPFSSKYTKLVDFDYTNGANPWGSLIQACDGKLGMKHSGGRKTPLK